MQKFYVSLVLVFTFWGASAQYPAAAGGFNKGNLSKVNLNIGHFYGRIVDDKKKGILGVTVQLVGSHYDTVTHKIKPKIVKTDITESNGDFDLDGISLIGSYKIKISSVGYKKIEMPVTFGIQRPAPGTTPDFQKILAMADKDLGDIKLEQEANELAAVTVTAPSKPVMEIGLDKKVFNVDKNLASTGQTATEIMKGIPSVSVDIDGNVTMRNATPTIFVDGRPTTLTLDEIPADIIDKIEVITNPSAKYDASGGGAGILNIVLKKNKRNGYNGNVRAGVDERGKVNGGGDINYRQNKINFSASANYNQRKSIVSTVNNTTYYTLPDSTNVDYNTKGTNNGHIQFYRAGIDYFADIRNTFSIAGNIAQGAFNNVTPENVDTSFGQTLSSYTSRTTVSNFNFQNVGAQLSYKHNYAKEGEDLTADANYNSVTNSNNTNIYSNTYNQFGGTQQYPTYQQQSNGSGYNHFFTLQSDYENPMGDDRKLEAGVRAAIRDFKTQNLQYAGDSTTPNQLPFSPSASSLYKYTDQVYAAYGTYSFKIKKVSMQLGLRAESSNYSGHLDSLPGQVGYKDTSFKVTYPISLFPSVYLTYKLDDNQSFQLNYSRKINRPNFFQILPVYNFSDPQNPSVGNPNLRPEFANNLEWSYSNNYTRTDNFLATAYLKYSTDLITSYLYKDINREQGASPSDSLFYTSYTNSNYSYSYGLELTDKMTVVKWWDLLLNFNLYDAQLNTNVPNQSTIDNSLVSWFSKVNSTFKLGGGVTFQVAWESRSKTLLPQNNGSSGGGGRGGGFFGGGPQTLAQGYTLPRYYDVDASIKKDWTFKGGKSASLTLSMNDIFRTGNKTQAYSTYFSQYTERYRDPQIARLNFSYRFGKVDVNLFKRKNLKADQSGALEGIGGGN